MSAEAAVALSIGSPPSISIAPRIAAGTINGRFEVQIRGRIVASCLIEQVELVADGYVLGQMQFGPEEEAAAAPLEVGPGVRRHNFGFSLWRLASEESRSWSFQIVARDSTGSLYEESYALRVEPGNSAAIVDTGPVSDDSETADPQPVIIYAERALMESGRLTVYGWAVSLFPIVTVQVFLDGERVGAALHGSARPDVGNSLPHYPNAGRAGFLVSRDVSGALPLGSRVKVQAIAAGGFAHMMEVPVEHVGEVPANLESPPQLPAGAVAASEGSVEGRRETWFFCDDAELARTGELSVRGWAVCAVGIASISILLDDQPLGEAELGMPRHDVGDEYLTIPMARYSGFQLSAVVGQVTAGEHTLTVVVRNALGDERSATRTLATSGPKQAPPVVQPAFGVEPVFRLEIDGPQISNGIVVEPVTGRMTIEGWALARAGVTGIDVLLDDQRIGAAHHGLARQDVGQAFPDWKDSVRSGFAFHFPPRLLRAGGHVAALHVRAADGAVMTRSFGFEVRRVDDDEAGGGTIRRRMSRTEMDSNQQVLDRLGGSAAFSLILRQPWPADEERLRSTLASLRDQTLREWRLIVLAYGPEGVAEVSRLLQRCAPDLEARVEICDGLERRPAPSWPTPHTGADRLFYGILSPGDELGCDALAEFAISCASAPSADLHYADEVRTSPVSHEREAFFKPDFSPDLLLSTNYIGRPWFASLKLLQTIGSTPAGLVENGEYDLVLRCAEQANEIRHIPKLLCRRGPEPTDAPRHERLALEAASRRRRIDAQVTEGNAPGTWRLKRSIGACGKVSIIIPTCAAKGHVQTCLTTLREKTRFQNYEIICIENIPDSDADSKVWLRDNADMVLTAEGAFNWSRFNNCAAERATGEYLLFLNDDIEIVEPGWLEAMLEQVQRPEVGIVGAQLLYPDRKVQHAGMFLAGRGTARHAFRFAAESDPGYFGLALTQRNVIAVTGACMLLRRDVFHTLGGFNEAHQVINNDVGLCLRAHRAGLLVVYTPFAKLVHHELASRERIADIYDTEHFERRWRTLFAAGDPFFSPRLSRDYDDCRPDDEPVEVVYAGHPLFRADEIRQILVVKLDHIGDFITALPAIRRLKQLFPHAKLTLLCGRAVSSFAETDDAIDDFVEFDFFHARSGLGKKEIDETEYKLLHDRLDPLHIDLAIDLRKHLDTREVLPRIPARLRAGFDHMGQFPFLDIALEWEGDKSLHRKRSHVSDDLLNLVEAVGTAARLDRTSITIPDPRAGGIDLVPSDVRALFVKPVVAVHPGVGNEMRQWPPAHFAALIDLLIERDGVHVVIVGGPDEMELADTVIGAVNHRHAVGSVVGRTPLNDLARLLQACALYIGNNSGPKHIAAAIGVPTIGIHSGVVDAEEWAPVGKQAVALRRAMSCSPCYLARRSDCPRELACLRGLEPAAVRQVATRFLAGARGLLAGVSPSAQATKSVQQRGTKGQARKPRRTPTQLTSLPPG